jgi:hypothetical protein
MIEQYLSNNNEKSYSTILQKFLDLNRPMVLGFKNWKIRSLPKQTTLENSDCLSKSHSLNYYMESHLRKNGFLYLFTLQQSSYIILCAL